MEPIVYCYDRCTTCKRALKFLKENNIEFKEIPVYTNPPTEDDFLKYFKETDLPSKRFFNTSGMVYRDLHLKDTVPHMTDEEKAKLLASDGRLVKRPLLIYNDKVYPGFNEKIWSEMLGISES